MAGYNNQKREVAADLS